MRVELIKNLFSLSTSIKHTITIAPKEWNKLITRGIDLVHIHHWDKRLYIKTPSISCLKLLVYSTIGHSMCENQVLLHPKGISVPIWVMVLLQPIKVWVWHHSHLLKHKNPVIFAPNQKSCILIRKDNELIMLLFT